MGSETKKILVTGGAGFVGTHCVVVLLQQGFKVFIIDNLHNSVEEAVHRVRELVGPDLSKFLEFHLVISCLIMFSFWRFSIIGKLCFYIKNFLGFFYRVILEIRMMSRSCSLRIRKLFNLPSSVVVV